jgi:hypothetical protein
MKHFADKNRIELSFQVDTLPSVYTTAWNYTPSSMVHSRYSRR